MRRLAPTLPKSEHPRRVYSVSYLISWFALVWLSNVYMALFANIRLDIHSERHEIKSKDLDVQSKSDNLRPGRAA